MHSKAGAKVRKIIELRKFVCVFISIVVKKLSFVVCVVGFWEGAFWGSILNNRTFLVFAEVQLEPYLTLTQPL